MLRKMVHKFWSRVLGIPMPQPRFPRLKVGPKLEEIRIRVKTKTDWKLGWGLNEEVDGHMAGLANTSWWPAKKESWDHINDWNDGDESWEKWLGQD
jgi:hypothetical protein